MLSHPLSAAFSCGTRMQSRPWPWRTTAAWAAPQACTSRSGPALCKLSERPKGGIFGYRSSRPTFFHCVRILIAPLARGEWRVVEGLLGRGGGHLAVRDDLSEHMVQIDVVSPVHHVQRQPACRTVSSTCSATIIVWTFRDAVHHLRGVQSK